MSYADTPMPGEDPGALIEDPARLDEIEPATEEDIEADPQPQPTPADPATGHEAFDKARAETQQRSGKPLS